jgi:hypothetical protein
MNRKIIALSGILGVCCATFTLCSSSAQLAVTTVKSQHEFDKVFGEVTDAKVLNLAGHAYDNQNARLFWFTDLEAAKRQARAEGKPILSLRLLGNLSDEYSCANSRFFRVLLYANKQINPILRNKFVLHWASERPVPVVTIDFGDGRKIKQTLTGNSAHYLLDDSGRPLDVLPGLYSPKEFEKWLTQGEKLATNWKAESGETREQSLQKWHEERVSSIWKEQVQAGGNEKWVQIQTEQSLKDNPLVRTNATVPPPSVVSAREAAPLARAKSVIERPMLNAINLFSTSSRVRDWIWGNPIQDTVKLDEETRRRIKDMNPRLETLAKNVSNSESGISGIVLTQQSIAISQRGAVTKGVTVQPADPFESMIQNFEQSINVDTAANKFRMEIPIHALFARGQEGSFESLNRKIYDILFLTPKSDPYLGLGSDGIFTGLQNGGIVQTASQ